MRTARRDGEVVPRGPVFGEVMRNGMRVRAEERHPQRSPWWWSAFSWLTDASAGTTCDKCNGDAELVELRLLSDLRVRLCRACLEEAATFAK